MALLFMDGFDVGDYAIKGWNATDSNSSSPGVFSLEPGRLSGTGLSIATATNGSSGQDMTARKFFTATSQLTVGFAIQPTAYSLGGNGGGFAITLYSDSGSTAHLTILSNATTQAIELRRGTRSGVLIASSASFIAVSTWAYIEIQATIADAGGICVVRLNGSPTPIIDFTGDTKNAGTFSTIDSITLGTYRAATQGGISSAIYDDLYILDSTGTTNTTFLGDVRAVTLRPNGAGTDAQLTPTGSATNWENVDETTYDTADYNASATVGQRDTYALADLPGGIVVAYGLQNNAVVSKDDVTTANITLPVRTGGNLYYGTTISPSTSYLTYSDIHQVNPATTNAWTVPEINNLEAGMELV